MTYTEIIAVKLFGWEACEAPPIETHRNVRWYQKMGSREHLEYVGYRSDDADICGTINRTVSWPNFADERLKWYWIRRMEDVLAERGLGKTYAQHLVSSLGGLPHDDAFDQVAVPCLRATAEQRVAACVKVLEEVQ